MSAVRFRYLTQQQVIDLGGLDMTQTVADIEEVLRLFATGQCVLPSKVVLRWGDASSETVRGRINGMPGYVGGQYNMAGFKWIASMPLNIHRGMPRASALTILNNPVEGFPVAVMDGTVISAMRTGAVSGVAAKYLSRPGVTTIGLIGAGVQNRTQLMAIKVARPELTKALVYDLLEDRVKAWCEDMSSRLDMEFESVGSAEEAARRSDILVTATTSASPIVTRGWLPKGALFCQVGGHECDLEAIGEADRVVADNWYEIKHRATQTLVEAVEKGVISEDAITDLGDIVAGRKPGRLRDSDRILFSSVGMGIEDIAVATRIFRRAEEANIGTMLTLWETPAFI